MGNHSKCFKCGELDEFCVCPAAPAYALKGATVPAGASMRDMLRWSQANTDYHGLIAFTQAQFDHFVSMVQAAAKAPAAQAVDARIPTEAMLNAARDWSVKKYGQGIGNDAAIGCWQAMYDASPANTPEASQQTAAVAAPSEQQANVLPPFAAPADQHEADTVAEISFLTEWLQFIGEPVGVECCGRCYGNGECCDNPVTVTVTLPELEKAMNERLNVLVAKLPASGFREGRNAQLEISAVAATTSEDARDAALEEAANAVASTNTLGMTAASAITKLCANIRALKSESAMRANQQEGGK